MNKSQTMCLVALVSMCAGIAIDRIIFNSINTFGVLKIDKSNPEKDLYTIDITKDLEAVSKKKYVVLKVQNENI